MCVIINSDYKYCSFDMANIYFLTFNQDQPVTLNKGEGHPKSCHFEGLSTACLLTKFEKFTINNVHKMANTYFSKFLQKNPSFKTPSLKIPLFQGLLNKNKLSCLHYVLNYPSFKIPLYLDLFKKTQVLKEGFYCIRLV